MACWLIKTEPGCFSIDDLAKSKKQTTAWDGVRNFQARNFLRDSMHLHDEVLFYHSVTNPAIAGIAKVASAPYPDPTQWDPEAMHFDPRSKAENPLWYAVDIQLVRKFLQPIPLGMLRGYDALTGMELLRKGSRLSVQPVSGEHFSFILHLEKELEDA